MINNEVINTYIKCYLIGAIEKTKDKDFGRGWREKLRDDLSIRIDNHGNPLHVFDPTISEAEKTGYNAKEFHEKLEDWIASGQRDKIKDYMNFIWKGKTYFEQIDAKSGQARLINVMGDIDYVRNSDFLIVKIEEGDMPCGTYFEAGLAYERNIPLYLIQTMALSKYNKSFLGWVLGSGGDIFPNQKQLIEFLDEKYKLKVKKDEKVKEL
jgi:hypothetical protein